MNNDTGFCMFYGGMYEGMKLIYRRLFDSDPPVNVKLEEHLLGKLDKKLEEERRALDRCETEVRARKKRVEWIEAIRFEGEFKDKSKWKEGIPSLPCWKQKKPKKRERSCSGDDEDWRLEKIRRELQDMFGETKTVRELPPVLRCGDSEKIDGGEPSKSHMSRPIEVFREHPRSINLNDLSVDEIISDEDAPGPHNVWKDKKDPTDGDKLKGKPKSVERLGAVEHKKPKTDKKLDNELNDSVEVIDIGGEYEESTVLRKDGFSLSTDVPRDYDQGSVGKVLNPVQRAVPTDPDQDNVDLLIGLSPNEKDLM